MQRVVILEVDEFPLAGTTLIDLEEVDSKSKRWVTIRQGALSTTITLGFGEPSGKRKRSSQTQG